MSIIAFAAAILAQAAAPPPAAPIRLARGSAIEIELGPDESREAVLVLRAGQSVDIVVLQQGIDVVVELLGPDGRLVDSVDSPNGRQGPEPVSLFARQAGTYRLRIKPIAANEPRGRITVGVAEFRDAAATRRLLETRRHAREAAAQWLRRLNDPLPADGRLGTADPLPAFDALAAGATIIGLGEATHGSREFNDLRLSLVQRLVERHGYRLIALEDSADRWRAVEPYLAGAAATPGAAPLEWGWIGRRSRRELLEWVRQWNSHHSTDQVRVVGVDPQDNQASRERLGAFLARVYGPHFTEAWNAQAAELAVADAQTSVFGDSGTSPALRQFMQEIVARLSMDGPLLRARFGEADFEQALDAARDLYAFVDFNSGRATLSHFRDWYMAQALVRAMDRSPTRAKAIYWAHNAHVSVAPTAWGPTGAVLRQAFGCGYRAVAATFGSGDFMAQVAGGPGARLATTTLAAAAAQQDTTENMLASVRPGAHLTTWTCDGAPAQQPEWLRVPRPLRWIGGVYAPDSLPSATYQPYLLTAAFDAIAYFPSVRAEAVQAERTGVPSPRRP